MSVRREKVRDPKSGAAKKEERYRVDVDLQLPDGSRRRVKKVAPVQTRRAAEQFERDLRTELLAGRYGREVLLAPTLREFAPRFIEGWAKANRQKYSGIRSKESILENHLLPRLGDRRLDAISDEDVQRLKAALARKSPKTVNNVLSVLGKLLRVAVRWRVIATMPTRIELLRAPARSMEFYEEEEFEQLVAGARAIGKDELLVVLLGGEAGLRSGELMGLEWSDISLPTKTLTVNRAIWRGIVDVPKSGKSRVVPLTERLVAALRDARHLRGPQVLLRPPEPGATAPQKYTQKTLEGRMRSATHRAGMPISGRIHILRHTFCSRLAMRGAPAMAIKELAGHADLSTTMRYMHLSPSARGQAIALLESTPPGSPNARPSEARGGEVTAT